MDNLTEEQMSQIRREALNIHAGDDIEAAKLSLKLDFAPLIRSYSRDLYTYNYRDKKFLNLEADELVGVDSTNAIDYAEEWQQAIFNHTPQESGMLGWGLYTAMDPLSTRRYGDSDFALVRVKIPGRTRILDLRGISLKDDSSFNEHYFRISSTSREMLRRICGDNALHTSGTLTIDGVTYFSVAKSSLTENETCNQIFADVLKELNITAIQYQYGGILARNCDAGMQEDSVEELRYTYGGTGTAFVMVTNKTSDENIDLFTSGSELSGQSFNQKEAQDFNDLVGLLESEYSDSPASRFHDAYGTKDEFLEALKLIKNESDVTLNDQFDSTSFIRKHHFGCGKEYEEEDKPQYNPENSIRIAIEELLDSNLLDGSVLTAICN